MVINNFYSKFSEMALEDGRFLVSPKRYEELRATHAPDALQALRLVPVHPGFQFYLKISYYIISLQNSP